MSVKYISSSKEKNKVVDNLNFCYDFHKENANGTKKFWRCERRVTCKARIHTNNDPPEIISRINEHNHPSTESEIKAHAAVSNVRVKVTWVFI